MLTFKTLKPLFTHLALFLPILFNPRNSDLGNKPNLFLSARSRVFIFSQNIYFLYWNAPVRKVNTFLNNIKPQILCVVHIWEACKNNQQIYSKCVRHTAFIKGMFVINC